MFWIWLIYWVLNLVVCVCVCVLQAEARLAAKRAARAEARSIRLKELERQQEEGGNVSLDWNLRII